jgi:uncharacterized protein YbjT (DUF2867 family)
VRPLAVGDIVEVLCAALVAARLPRRTVALTGPTELGLDQAARLVADVLGRDPSFVPLPIGFHYMLARLAERLMTAPLISVAQVRILAEQVIQPSLAPDSLPADLAPSTPFDQHSIRAGLPDPGPFQLADLRFWRRLQHGAR